MDSFNDIWNQVLILCKKEITEVSYNLWISTMRPIKFEADTAFLSTSSAFNRKLIVEKFSSMLSEKFTLVMGFDVAIEVIVEEDENELKKGEDYRETTEPEYTFDTFVVGSSNRFAHACCIRVAQVPGVEYNPLFIYGRSGVGKTHLLFAIENEMKSTNPNLNIRYTTGENFTNELISALSEKNTAFFHDKYRNVDVLLVDDIHFIAGKVSTQEEFFHTFNALIQAGRQIVLTSDRPPKEMETLDERIRTRFEWGLIADIQPPDVDTRMAIVKQKAKRLKFELPDTIVELIADKLKTNIRQLEGTVKKVYANLSLNYISPTNENVMLIIKEIQEGSKPIATQTEEIIEHVARFYNVTSEDIKSNKKAAPVALARQVSMYVIRETTDLTLQTIGDFFGGKNYSTVIYSISTIEDKILHDAVLKNTINDIIKNIHESNNL